MTKSFDDFKATYETINGPLPEWVRLLALELSNAGYSSAEILALINEIQFNIYFGNVLQELRSIGVKTDNRVRDYVTQALGKNISGSDIVKYILQAPEFEENRKNISTPVAGQSR